MVISFEQARQRDGHFGKVGLLCVLQFLGLMSSPNLSIEFIVCLGFFFTKNISCSWIKRLVVDYNTGFGGKHKNITGIANAVQVTLLSLKNLQKVSKVSQKCLKSV